jgi:hypothetical protein
MREPEYCRLRIWVTQSMYWMRRSSCESPTVESPDTVALSSLTRSASSESAIACPERTTTLVALKR